MIDLERAKAICEAATPGPWEIGVRYWSAGVNDGTHKDWTPPKSIGRGECAFCHHGEPVRVFKDSAGGTMHTHRCGDYDDEWHIIATADGNITGNYDYEEGGVCSQREDAEFIAEARTLLPAALEEIESLRRALKVACGWCTRHTCKGCEAGEEKA